jgi:hypothetical protein
MGGFLIEKPVVIDFIVLEGKTTFIHNSTFIIQINLGDFYGKCGFKKGVFL